MAAHAELFDPWEAYQYGLGNDETWHDYCATIESDKANVDRKLRESPLYQLFADEPGIFEKFMQSGSDVHCMTKFCTEYFVELGREDKAQFS